MSYKNKITKNKVVIFTAVIGLLIFSHFFGFSRPLESWLSYLFNPFFSGFYSFSTNLRSGVNAQLTKSDLTRALKEMEAERNQSLADNAKMKTLENENKILRQYLDFLDEKKYRYVMASVVSRSKGNGAEGGIMIDKGEADGIYPGLAVVNSQGVLVGKIAQTKDHVSLVHLSTEPRCELAAAIESQNRTIGVTKGDLGITIKMDYIPQTESIAAGIIVVTSGLEEGIPSGLVIGKIDRVSRESNELWQTAVIDPLTNFNELAIVSVILP